MSHTGNLLPPNLSSQTGSSTTNTQDQGTTKDLYVVEWIPNDPRNPMLFSTFRKWLITLSVSVATLSNSFCLSSLQ